MLLRPLFISSFTAISLLTLPVYAAAPTAADIQNQLQAEWSDFTTRVGVNSGSNSKIQVTQSGNSYKAVLPILTIRLQDNNHITLDNINVVATPSAAGTVDLKVTLPKRIPQYYSSTETGALTIGKQDLNIAVKPAGDTWQVQTVNGQMSDLNWQQNKDITTNPRAPLQATIGQLSLNGKPSELQLRANNISAKDVGGATQTISQLLLTQQPSSPQSLSLSDILVLLTDSLPQLESGRGGMASWLEGAAGMTAEVRDSKTTDETGKTTLAFDKLILKNSLAGITDNKMTIRSTGSVTGIQMALPPAFAQTTPRTLDFTTTLRNLPAQYFTMPFNTPEAQEKARAALAAAKTQLQIDSLNVDTTSGLKASGTGLLTATTAAPTYTSGDITLNLTNLQETMAKIQQQRSPAQSQLVMALMVLQGMGQKSPTGNQTQYIVTLTPAGGVLVNNQDLSGVLALAGLGSPAAKPANTGRAIPVAPVTTEDAPPASTPWKKP